MIQCIPNASFRVNITSYSQFIVDYCEHRDKQLFDSDDGDHTDSQLPEYTFQQLSSLVQRILDCDYLDNLVEDGEEEQEEESADVAAPEEEVEVGDPQVEQDVAAPQCHDAPLIQEPLHPMQSQEDIYESETAYEEYENNYANSPLEPAEDLRDEDFPVESQHSAIDGSSNVNFNKDSIDDFVVVEEKEINDAMMQGLCLIFRWVITLISTNHTITHCNSHLELSYRIVIYNIPHPLSLVFGLNSKYGVPLFTLVIID